MPVCTFSEFGSRWGASTSHPFFDVLPFRWYSDFSNTLEVDFLVGLGNDRISASASRVGAPVHWDAPLDWTVLPGPPFDGTSGDWWQFVSFARSPTGLGVISWRSDSNPGYNAQAVQFHSRGPGVGGISLVGSPFTAGFLDGFGGASDPTYPCVIVNTFDGFEGAEVSLFVVFTPDGVVHGRHVTPTGGILASSTYNFDTPLTDPKQIAGGRFFYDAEGPYAVGSGPGVPIGFHSPANIFLVSKEDATVGGLQIATEFGFTAQFQGAWTSSQPGGLGGPGYLNWSHCDVSTDETEIEVQQYSYNLGSTPRSITQTVWIQAGHVGTPTPLAFTSLSAVETCHTEWNLALLAAPPPGGVQPPVTALFQGSRFHAIPPLGPGSRSGVLMSPVIPPDPSYPFFPMGFGSPSDIGFVDTAALTPPRTLLWGPATLATRLISTAGGSILYLMAAGGQSTVAPCCGPATIPPTRIFPRDDTQGISTARVRIGRSQPSSRQQSYRQGFRGTYT